MVITVEQQIIDIEIEWTRKRQVESFIYLGVTLEDNGGEEVDIDVIINKTSRIFYIIYKKTSKN